MPTSINEYLQEAAQTIYQLSKDEMILKRCREREEFYEDMRNYDKAIAELEAKIEQDRIEHEQVIAQTEEKYERIIAEQSQQIELLRTEIEQLKKTHAYTHGKRTRAFSVRFSCVYKKTSHCSSCRASFEFCMICAIIDVPVCSRIL